MKKFITLFTLMLVCIGQTFAYDFEVNGIYYKVSGNNVTVTSRTNYDYSDDYSGDIVIPSSVTYNGKTYSVTSIGKDAFTYCFGLTSVTIPSTVTSIGDYAFWCSGLISITIPNSVTSIGDYAFEGCTGLTSITIPNSVTSIGIEAFICSGLTYIKVDEDNRTYDSREGCNAIIETASNTLIRGSNTTVIPNSVTSIGDYAFSGCSDLTSITIPNSVKSIGECAFADCTGLTSVTIPNSVTNIGNYAFSGCSGLTYIKVDEDNRTYDSREGCNAIIETASNTLIQGSNTTVIPNSVTSIGWAAFSGCSDLTSITIPNSVTSIGWAAFAYCM